MGEREVDQELVKRVQRGDKKAFDLLVIKYQQKVANLVSRYIRDPGETQDVTQEAFINAFRRIKQYRGDSPFWGWLRRVVVNHAISALRKLPRHAAVELQEHMSPRNGDQGGMGQCMDLEQALQQLSDEDRMVVWLHDVEGYKHLEIANLVGKTESYSKTRLNRARTRLRTLITEADTPTVQNAISNATA